MSAPQAEMSDTEILEWIAHEADAFHVYGNKLSDSGCGCCSYGTEMPDAVAARLEELMAPS